MRTTVHVMARAVEQATISRTIALGLLRISSKDASTGEKQRSINSSEDQKTKNDSKKPPVSDSRPMTGQNIRIAIDSHQDENRVDASLQPV